LPAVAGGVSRWRVVILYQTSNLETHMADPQKSAQDSASISLTGRPFASMSGSEKVTWLGKCFIMLISGGFVFPNIFVE
jgi:hypothetical protein